MSSRELVYESSKVRFRKSFNRRRAVAMQTNKKDSANRVVQLGLLDRHQLHPAVDTGGG